MSDKDKLLRELEAPPQGVKQRIRALREGEILEVSNPNGILPFGPFANIRYSSGIYRVEQRRGILGHRLVIRNLSDNRVEETKMLSLDVEWRVLNDAELQELKDRLRGDE